LIEGSTCLDQITVQVFMYGRSGFPRESLGVRIEPHPDLKLIYNSADTLVSGESDLAIIHLERPIKDIASVALATAQPASGSRVTIVGYGYTDLERSRLGVRYFGRTIISEISGELLRVAGPGAQAHEGDSGGPCLKWIRGEANPVLVGINRGGNAPFYSTFTSTAFPRNREWIEKIIRADLASP
jgi:hypothetical protein